MNAPLNTQCFSILQKSPILGSSLRSLSGHCLSEYQGIVFCYITQNATYKRIFTLLTTGVVHWYYNRDLANLKKKKRKKKRKSVDWIIPTGKWRISICKILGKVCSFQADFSTKSSKCLFFSDQIYVGYWSEWQKKTKQTNKLDWYV